MIIIYLCQCTIFIIECTYSHMWCPTRLVMAYDNDLEGSLQNEMCVRDCVAQMNIRKIPHIPHDAPFILYEYGAEYKEIPYVRMYMYVNVCICMNVDTQTCILMYIHNLDGSNRQSIW